MFHGVSLRGCAFHWGKAVQMQAKSLRVTAAAAHDAKLGKLLQRIQMMQFLPSGHINEAYQKFKASSQRYCADHPLHSFLDYMRKQWVESTTFPSSSWSQYGIKTRTNNDLEGWLRSLNASLGPRPHLYGFIKKTSMEAEMTEEVITVEDFTRRTSERQTRREESIARLQRRYEMRELTPGAYLDAMSHLYKIRTE